MGDIFRETAFGKTVRFVSRNTIFQYPEERPDFQLPSSYNHVDGPPIPENDRQLAQEQSRPRTSEDEEKALDKTPGDADSSDDDSCNSSKEDPQPIVPSKSEDGTILVDWYTTDDPDNPRNWTGLKKAFVVLQIWYKLPGKEIKEQSH